MESGWFKYGYGGTLGLNTKEDESHLFQNREKEEFILFAVDMLCILGAGVSLVMGIEYSGSFSDAPWIALATMILLLGFAFDRGSMSAYLPSIVRERVWWVGPCLFTGLLLMKMLIEGSLFEQTLGDSGLLVAIVFAFWMLGAGLKRMLVRGKFVQAYRGMAAKAGERKFRLNKTLLIGTIVIVVIINLLSFVFDIEEFPSTLSASLFFLVIVNMCVPESSESPKTQNARITEYDE